MARKERVDQRVWLFLLVVYLWAVVSRDLVAVLYALFLIFFPLLAGYLWLKSVGAFAPVKPSERTDTPAFLESNPGAVPNAPQMTSTQESETAPAPAEGGELAMKGGELALARPEEGPELRPEAEAEVTGPVEIPYLPGLRDWQPSLDATRR